MKPTLEQVLAKFRPVFMKGVDIAIDDLEILLRDHGATEEELDRELAFYRAAMIADHEKAVTAFYNDVCTGDLDRIGATKH